MKSRQNNPQNNNGFTPMHRAAFLGDVDTVNALGGGRGGSATNDAITNAPDNSGRTRCIMLQDGAMWTNYFFLLEGLA